MSESKSQDHWKALALLLDVSVPDEPEEAPVVEAAEPEHAAAAEPQADLPQQAGDQPQEPTPESPASMLPEPTRPVVQPPRSRPAPRPSAPRTDVNHWRGLAGVLGIEVPDEEPEEAEEAVVEAELVAEAEPVAEPERVAAEPPDDIEDGAGGGWSEPGNLFPPPVRDAAPDWLSPVVFPDAEAQFEPLAPEADPVSAPAPAAHPTRTPPSLFDSKAFSIDTPGVLDRIFEDSDEDTRPAIPAGFEEREEFSEIDDDLDEAIDLALDEDDDDLEEADLEAASDAEVSPQPAATEPEGDEPRRRRRRRRRRRKPDKNGADAAAADEPAADARRSREPSEATAVDQDLDEELHDDADDRCEDGHDEEDHDDDHHDDDHHDEDHDEDDDDLLTLGVKHRKIPTWDEAVQVVISANMESRAKNPGNGPRGRGRGRGRRP